MITVMGATGHTGRAIAESLLAAGERVRVLGRSADRLAPLVAAGAEAAAGDAGDRDHLTRAFGGSDAVYTLQPSDPTAPDFPAEQDRLGEAIAAAVAATGVPCVVMLSSVGSGKASGNGPIAGLHRQEERLRKIPGIDLLILRPGYFYENLYESLPLIRHQGINGGAIGPDVRIPAVATRDIAAVAAEALRRRDWKGIAIRELNGPAPITFAEMTRTFGERIGKPDLPYVHLPYDGFQAALEQAGLSPSFAALYTEMSRGFNDGTIAPEEGWTDRTRTPTSFAAIADEIAAAYAAG